MSHGDQANSLHSRLIREFVAVTPGAQTTGFAAALRALAARRDWEWDCPSLLRSVIPDVFVIDAADETETSDARFRLTAVEVQVTSPLTARKLDLYIGLWWELDAIERDHELFLRLIDRNGSVFEVDMVDLAYQYVTEEPTSTDDLPRAWLAPLRGRSSFSAQVSP